MVGGEGIEVQIDDSLFSKRKYHQGGIYQVNVSSGD